MDPDPVGPLITDPYPSGISIATEKKGCQIGSIQYHIIKYSKLRTYLFSYVTFLELRIWIQEDLPDPDPKLWR
jgi:hypothetical protein